MGPVCLLLGGPAHAVGKRARRERLLVDALAAGGVPVRPIYPVLWAETMVRREHETNPFAVEWYWRRWLQVAGL